MLITAKTDFIKDTKTFSYKLKKGNSYEADFYHMAVFVLIDNEWVPFSKSEVIENFDYDNKEAENEIEEESGSIQSVEQDRKETTTLITEEDHKEKGDIGEPQDADHDLSLERPHNIDHKTKSRFKDMKNRMERELDIFINHTLEDGQIELTQKDLSTFENHLNWLVHLNRHSEVEMKKQIKVTKTKIKWREIEQAKEQAKENAEMVIRADSKLKEALSQDDSAVIAGIDFTTSVPLRKIQFHSYSPLDIEDTLETNGPSNRYNGVVLRYDMLTKSGCIVHRDDNECFYRVPFYKKDDSMTKLTETNIRAGLVVTYSLTISKNENHVCATDIHIIGYKKKVHTIYTPDKLHSFYTDDIFRYGIANAKKEVMKKLNMTEKEVDEKGFTTNDYDYVFIKTSNCEYRIYQNTSPITGDGKVESLTDYLDLLNMEIIGA